jgi:hypothetical protein
MGTAELSKYYNRIQDAASTAFHFRAPRISAEISLCQQDATTSACLSGFRRACKNPVHVPKQSRHGNILVHVHRSKLSISIESMAKLNTRYVHQDP